MAQVTQVIGIELQSCPDLSKPSACVPTMPCWFWHDFYLLKSQQATNYDLFIKLFPHLPGHTTRPVQLGSVTWLGSTYKMWIEKRCPVSWLGPVKLPICCPLCSLCCCPVYSAWDDLGNHTLKMAKTDSLGPWANDATKPPAPIWSLLELFIWMVNKLLLYLSHYVFRSLFITAVSPSYFLCTVTIILCWVTNYSRIQWLKT